MPDAPTTFSDAVPALDGIEGWLTHDQARRLWDSARRLPPGARAVEIGSFRGRSAIITAMGLPDGARLAAIDPHAGNDRGPQEIAGKEAEAETDHAMFLTNLERAGVRERVDYVRQFSDAAHNAFEGDIDLLYIDGAHRYAPARDDIVTWGARVAPGGTMLIHDSFSAIGLTFALLTTLTPSDQWQYMGRSGSMAEYRKVPLSADQRRRSAMAQAAQLPWFATNVVIKVLIWAHLRPVARALGFPDDKHWPY